MADFYNVQGQRQIENSNSLVKRTSFAMIPATAFATAYLFLLLMLTMSMLRTMAIEYYAKQLDYFFDDYDVLFFEIAVFGAVAVGWFAVVALLFRKKINILLPIVLGLLLFAHVVIQVLTVVDFDPESTSFWYTLYSFLVAFTATVLCVLFVINAPSIKRFAQQTCHTWSTLLLLMSWFKVIFHLIVVYGENWDYFFREEGIYAHLLLDVIYSSTPFFLANVVEGVFLYSLLRWLANPYETNNAVQQPVEEQTVPFVAVPEYHKPVVPFVEPPAFVVNKPFVPPVNKVQEVPEYVDVPVTRAKGSAVEEIIKAKELFDLGVITAEEFEKLKADIFKR